MEYLINNEDSDSESQETVVGSTIQNCTKPYITILLTKHGVDKLNKGKDVFNLPLADLRDPPHISDIYTIGDLFRFMEKNQYIKQAIEYYITGVDGSHGSQESPQNKKYKKTPYKSHRRKSSENSTPPPQPTQQSTKVFATEMDH
jgi:hypothetical protein